MYNHTYTNFKCFLLARRLESEVPKRVHLISGWRNNQFYWSNLYIWQYNIFPLYLNEPRENIIIYVYYNKRLRFYWCDLRSFICSFWLFDDVSSFTLFWTTCLSFYIIYYFVSHLVILYPLLIIIIYVRLFIQKIP